MSILKLEGVYWIWNHCVHVPFCLGGGGGGGTYPQDRPTFCNQIWYGSVLYHHELEYHVIFIFKWFSQILMTSFEPSL